MQSSLLDRGSERSLNSNNTRKLQSVFRFVFAMREILLSDVEYVAFRNTWFPVVNDTVVVFMLTDDSYTYGEHGIISRDVEILCCTPETNVTLCQLYSNLKF